MTEQNTPNIYDKALAYSQLRDLCGYYQNGTDTTVRLRHDPDKDKVCIEVGKSTVIFGDTLLDAIDNAGDRPRILPRTNIEEKSETFEKIETLFNHAAQLGEKMSIFQDDATYSFIVKVDGYCRGYGSSFESALDEALSEILQSQMRP